MLQRGVELFPIRTLPVLCYEVLNSRCGINLFPLLIAMILDVLAILAPYMVQNFRSNLRLLV